MENKAKKLKTSIFWLLWGISLPLILFYSFTTLIEVGSVRSGNILSYLSPIIGVVVVFAQLAVAIYSYKQANQVLLPSKPYLTLVGGTIIVGLLWIGGCASMGPLY